MKVEPIREKEDIKKFKNAAKRKRDKLMIELGLNSGMRIGDILRLKVKDVENNNHIEIIEEKTSKSRKIKLNPNVKESIEEYIEEKGLTKNDYLFQSRKGDNNPISKTQAYRVIKEIGKRAGLDDIKIGTHTLRKTFGYFHYRKFKDIAQLQTIFNHSTPRQTLDYIGVTQEEIDKSIQEMYL